MIDHPFDRLPKDFVLWSTVCTRDEIEECKKEACEYVRLKKLDYRYAKIVVKENEEKEFFVLVLKR